MTEEQRALWRELLDLSARMLDADLPHDIWGGDVYDGEEVLGRVELILIPFKGHSRAELAAAIRARPEMKED